MWPDHLKNPCVICSKRCGEIQILDGFICKQCMPKEFLKNADSLCTYQILAYHKTHKNSTRANSEETTKKICMDRYEDRSMVITPSSPISLVDDLNKQILSAESIDIVVSFILCSGLNLLIDSLTEFTDHGKLRVLTTTYLGATEYEALEQLVSLPNTSVKIELNSLEHRLHAKAFLFNRSKDNSTAYVGSANISKSALVAGEEWEVKLREQDYAAPIEDVRRSFESLWNSSQFITVTKNNRALIESALMQNKGQ